MRRLLDRKIFLNQSGVAAIFVVIFFALLIGIITLSFATIANQDQQRSTNNDLAQSAYDSSQAGIEDGRRLLVSYYKCLKDGEKCTTDPAEKLKYESVFNSNDNNGCNAIVKAKTEGLINIDGNISGNTVSVKSGSNSDSNTGGDLQQAYTCVNIKTKTPDYQTSLRANQSRLIPLKAVDKTTGSPAHTGEVTLNWFMAARDAGSGDNFTYPSDATPLTLPTETSDWGSNTPSIMRVQIIQIDPAVPVNPSTVNDNSRTLFLYPQEGNGLPEVSSQTEDLGRRIPKNVTTPKKVLGCVESKTANAYGFACKVKLTDFDTSKDYYLRVTPLYNGSTFNITMASNLLFDNVQPTIDSTGRANDLYRRSFTRMNPININDVTFDADFTSTDSICKDYSVGGSTGDFNAGSCN